MSLAVECTDYKKRSSRGRLIKIPKSIKVVNSQNPWPWSRMESGDCLVITDAYLATIGQASLKSYVFNSGKKFQALRHIDLSSGDPFLYIERVS